MIDLMGQLHHLSPDTVINLLRLALDLAKFRRDKFKDPRTPERAEQILAEAEKQDPSTLDASEIGRRLSDVLDPVDAEIVRSDLELLGLLAIPAPNLDAFDYWGMLQRLVDGLRVYAHQKRLFELRGVEKGRILVLPTVGAAMLPRHVAAGLATPYEMEGLKDVDPIALLRHDDAEFPVTIALEARFYKYSSMGGEPGVQRDSCSFDVAQGQQRHWLSFDRGRRFSPHFRQAVEYPLEAADFSSICVALRNDVQKHAASVQADEQSIKPLFGAIDAFTKSIGQ